MAKKAPPPPTTVGFGALADALRSQGIVSAAPAETATVLSEDSHGSSPTPAGKVLVRRETKGRRGKTVTTVARLPHRGAALDSWLTLVKNRLGTGASLDGDVVVIQGDHVDRVLALLAEAP